LGTFRPIGEGIHPLLGVLLVGLARYVAEDSFILICISRPMLSRSSPRTFGSANARRGQ
jgi:hypothetical protein